MANTRPGITVTEVDRTTSVPAVGTSVGAIVGYFNWGPVDVPVLVNSEQILKDVFGTPNVDDPQQVSDSYFTAISFLKYTGSLYVSRTTGKDISVAPDLYRAEIIKPTSTGSSHSHGSIFAISNRKWLEGRTIEYSHSIDGVTIVLNENGKEVYTWSDLTSLTKDTFSNQGFEIILDGGNLNQAFHILNGQLPDGSGGAGGNFISPGKMIFEVNTTPDNDAINTKVASIAKADYIKGKYFGDKINGHKLVVKKGALSTANKELLDITLENVYGVGVESYEGVSVSKSSKTYDGRNNYWVEVINSSSSLVSVDANDHTFEELLAIEEDTFSGGETVNEVSAGFDFNAFDNTNVNFIIAGHIPYNETSAITYINSIVAVAEKRRDVVAFVSPPISIFEKNPPNLSAAIKEFFDKTTGSSYVVRDSSPLKVLDKDNDVYKDIPANGHIAGLCANVDNTTGDPWVSPAGESRGRLLGVTDILYNPTDEERSVLHPAGVNSIINRSGSGIVLFGDRTSQAETSVLQRIGVRRLFLLVEKSVSEVARFFLFEQNTPDTRINIVGAIDPFLREIKGRGGLLDYRVVCDNTNNSSSEVQQGRLYIDLYLRPSVSVENIHIRAIATRNNVEFTEITG